MRGPYGELLTRTHRLLESLSEPMLAAFLEGWPSCEEPQAPANRAETRAEDRTALPVLRWLAPLGADEHGFAQPLVTWLSKFAAQLTWHQTYSAAELGANFIENYGWTELLGPRGVVTRSQIACGLLLLGPHTLYPPHRHEAEELYVPLRGTAEWRQGDAIWRSRAPGSLIHHRSEEVHAMRTREQPLLALYLWRSADLAQRARLDPSGGA